jgi:transposase
MTSITIGIDISKLKFDVYLIDGHKLTRQKTFTNDIKGFEAVKDLIPANVKVSVAIEATGCYGDNLVRYLHNCNVQVFVLNPAQVKYYAKSTMLRTKTDKVDAKVICNFLQLHQENLTVWQPKSVQLEELQGLYRYLVDIKEERVRTLGRIEACSNSDAAGKKISLSFYEFHLKHLDDELKSATAKALEIVSNCAILTKQYELLLSIPGVGEQTALGILAELPDIESFVNAKQLAAYAGLNPAIRESGSSVKGRGGISRVGSKPLRHLLYMPALAALRFNPIIKAFGERLKEKNKNGKVIVVAAMRKLLHMIYGILKSGQPFTKEATAR